MPFPKGKSGNPGGRPKEKEFREALNYALRKQGADKERRPKRLLNIAEQLVKKAEDGEPWAIKEVFDRIDGKPEAAVSVTGNHTVNHTSESVSETAGWLAEMLGTAADISSKNTLPN